MNSIPCPKCGGPANSYFSLGADHVAIAMTYKCAACGAITSLMPAGISLSSDALPRQRRPVPCRVLKTLPYHPDAMLLEESP